MLDIFFQGFIAVFTVKSIALIALGVAVGIIFGSIPGLTATMAVALFLPITFSMQPIEGIVLLIGLYIGGISGGLIPAILLNIPGTPSSIATTFDGYPMSQKGETRKALTAGITFSFLGGLLSIFALILISPPLAKVALKFTPFEYFAVSVFSLTMIASVSGNSLTKGLLSGLIGISLALVGTAPIDACQRYTFGIDELNGGFSLLPALIGLFAVSEILKTAENNKKLLHNPIKNNITKGIGFSKKEFLSQIGNFLRSSMIGVGIGILPGIGGATSNFIAYITAKNRSKYPEKFGTGILDGIVASESSNNASIGGALIPLLTLGIPGDAVTAMLLGGLIIHGLTPGPLLFKTSGQIVYGIFIALIIANIFMFIMELFGIRLFMKLLRIPKYILLPIIISLCVVGCFGVNNRLFDVWSLLFFGILGYVLDKFEFPLTPIILGFILGPIAERNLRRGLMYTNGSFLPFITRPIAAMFLIIAVLSIGITLWKRIHQPKKQMNLKIDSASSK